MVDNLDFIPLALYDLGGASQFVDVEDLFYRAFELAPDRFSWRTRHLPNYKTIYKALRDFEARNPDLLLKRGDGLARQLSVAGIEWTEQRLTRLEHYVKRPGENPATRRPSQRALNEIASHPLFADFASAGTIELVKHRVADVLACAPDSSTDVWRERLETNRAAATAAGRSEIVAFLDYIARERPEWFGGMSR
jgi:hypothetical protein